MTINLADRLKTIGIKPVPGKRTEPLWQGPEDGGDMGGVTQSMLSRWLTCRERARLHYIEGLKGEPRFSAPMEYGSIWHVCEQQLAQGTDPNCRTDQWAPLITYCRKLCRQYPTQQADVEKWMQVCKVQFPQYVQFWQTHPDVQERTPLLQEQVFHVPYQLPSGRTVYLKGKWDSVDLVGKGSAAGIVLKENKTKGDIDEERIRRQVTFDLQCMLYLTALYQDTGIEVLEEAKEKTAIKGVCYNVIRRPLSGGKGSIVRKKGRPSRKLKSGKMSKVVAEETTAAFYTRLGKVIAAAPETFFMRWRIEVSQADVDKFRRTCLDPILENLCWWYEQVTYRGDTPHKFMADIFHRYGVPPMNWRHPFGCRSVLDEGGASDLDWFLETGSEVGLQRVDELFGELKEEV